jgi:periplasmic divalent cation tolerance protein
MNADGEIVVLITAPDQETAHEIATYLVEKRLAACVNLISPIQSIYSWEGEIHLR